MKVVLDCNVLISAGLNAGTCRTVLSDVVRAHQLVLSQAILQEYVTVAPPPPLCGGWEHPDRPDRLYILGALALTEGL